jgi:hypothetical protein
MVRHAVFVARKSFLPSKATEMGSLTQEGQPEPRLVGELSQGVQPFEPSSLHSYSSQNCVYKQKDCTFEVKPQINGVLP